MPKVNFRLAQSYTQLPNDPVLRPYVPVRLQKGAEYQDTVGLIDSGADTSLFNDQYAVALGLDLADGKPSRTQGVGGIDDVVCFDIYLLVYGKRFAARVQFSSKWPPRYGLLGRNDFFQAFRVGFIQPRLYLHNIG